MKRFICIIVVLILIYSFSSCANQTHAIKNPITFYYRTETISFGTGASVICAETREIIDASADTESIIAQYLNGPQSNGCTSPFPAGTVLESYSIDNNKALIALSPHLAILNGSDLMIACACLTKTITDLTGVKSVQIRAVDSLLNNQESITVTADDFYSIDESFDYISTPD